MEKIVIKPQENLGGNRKSLLFPQMETLERISATIFNQIHGEKHPTPN